MIIILGGGGGFIDQLIDYPINRASLSGYPGQSTMMKHSLPETSKEEKNKQWQKITVQLQYEPVHNKTYNKTCVNSKDSDQPVHPPSIEKVVVYPFLDTFL